VVLTDRRFSQRRSAAALEIAEHLLAQAASGERDLERLKSSAFSKLSDAPERQEGLPGSSARRG
jgi:hypothetical protein